ncbi:MAG: homocysteine S-methyltransferase family protein [Ilumatobacteraceae bacterium]|nr:homocysteine S-methyltransferase family protein [Acidimicrobiales bacterium]
MSASDVTILDGGMGRELLRIGAPFRQPEWSALALLEGPSWVVQAHRNFVEAGAQVITTNSYAVVPYHLGDERFAAHGHDLAALAGRLAREAVEGTEARVAGSLPPLFGSYRPDRFDAATAPSIVDPLVDALAPSVDVWLGETMSSIAEVLAVRAALDRAGDRRELWISYTLDDHRPGVLRSGEAVVEAVAAALDVGATTVLFNCCQAETITASLDAAVRRVDGRAQVGAYANRFVDSHTDDGEANEQLAGLRADLDPAAYGEFVSRWLDAGLTVVGGCCGMEPAHVAALADVVARR